MEKPTAAALAAFDRAFPTDPRATRKSMFGMPAGFVNGNLFLGVWMNGLVLRLPDARLAALAGRPGVGAFEPMEGRAWKEYLLADVSCGDADLAAWALEALDHTATLPPKAAKPKKAKGA